MSDRRLDMLPLQAQMEAWLRDQDPDEVYNWCYSDRCACGQFATAIGRFEEWVRRREFDLDWGRLDTQVSIEPHTFGALLNRLSALRG